MNCFSLASSCTAALFRRTSHFVARGFFYERSTSLWRRNTESDCVKTSNLNFVLTSSQCYSSKIRRSRKSTSEVQKMADRAAAEEEKDAFFVVRKGDLIAVYKSLNDCQAQVGSSVCDPPVSVYKGYSLPKGTEDYLNSYGFKNALYTIRASDLKEDTFGTLTACPFQEPASSQGESSSKVASKRRSQQELGSEVVDTLGSIAVFTDPFVKHVKLDHHAEPQALSSDSRTCILEFDGSSKGNPGQAGAGAVLRANDGSLICKLREGLGIATNNVAEYRAMILGLKHALRMGYTGVRVLGDSKLVCMQVQGKWKVKHHDMSKLYEEAKKLKDKFLSFQIDHVLRDGNSEADAQANLAIRLADGQVQEEFGG